MKTITTGKKIIRVEKCLLVIETDNVQAYLVEHKTKTITNYDCCLFYSFKIYFLSFYYILFFVYEKGFPRRKRNLLAILKIAFHFY